MPFAVTRSPAGKTVGQKQISATMNETVFFNIRLFSFFVEHMTDASGGRFSMNIIVLQYYPNWNSLNSYSYFMPNTLINKNIICLNDYEN